MKRSIFEGMSATVSWNRMFSGRPLGAAKHRASHSARQAVATQLKGDTLAQRLRIRADGRHSKR
jgi:hypothetical protein